MEDTDVLFPLGTVLAIKEPYFKLEDGNEIPTVRVDAPSDIVFLDARSQLAQSAAWATNHHVGAPLLPTTPEDWKKRGNGYFKRRQWLCAAVAYSEGLKLDSKHHLLLLNRAAAYLELHWYNSAAHDAETALSMGLDDPVLKRKAVLRAVRAHYSAERFSKVTQLAKLLPQDSDIRMFASNALQRIRERDGGKYDWGRMYRQTRTPGCRLDVAPYQGPVEVKDVNGRRAVFATREVLQGDLLVRHLLYLAYTSTC